MYIQRESRYEGDLVAKCYFKKRKLVWEALDGNLKTKIEFLWSKILAIKQTDCHASQTRILEIMLSTFHNTTKLNDNLSLARNEVFSFAP